VVEWRARRHPTGRLRYLFPLLAAVGGLLLLTHSHAAFEPRSYYLIQVTHTTMGGLAVLMACARWLELRLGPPRNRIAGAVSNLAMLLIALVLVFYQEANVVVPPV
jgi:putative copper resistance protein D